MTMATKMKEEILLSSQQRTIETFVKPWKLADQRIGVSLDFLPLYYFLPSKKILDFTQFNRDPPSKNKKYSHVKVWEEEKRAVSFEQLCNSINGMTSLEKLIISNQKITQQSKVNYAANEKRGCSRPYCCP